MVLIKCSSAKLDSLISILNIGKISKISQSKLKANRRVSIKIKQGT